MKFTARFVFSLVALVAIAAFGLEQIHAHLGLPAAVAALALPYAFSLALNPPSLSLGAAATADVDTAHRPAELLTLPVAAATKIFAGTLVARNADGRAVPASDTAGLRVVGRAEMYVDNSAGAAGDLSVVIRLGTYRFANSVANAVDADDVGKMAVVEDDQTVAETSANKVCAGRILAVEAAGIWIDTRAAYFGPKALVALTSVDGVAAAAADLNALKAEAEKIGDDVRALHASLFG